MLKLKFVRNSAALDVTNSSFKTVIFNPKEMLGILDLMLIGYYKVKHGILQQNLSKYYNLKQLMYFVKFVNTLRKEEKDVNDQYPWLDKYNERRNMSVTEILEKYIDLQKSCLSESEKKRSNGYVIQV